MKKKICGINGNLELDYFIIHGESTSQFTNLEGWPELDLLACL